MQTRVTQHYCDGRRIERAVRMNTTDAIPHIAPTRSHSSHVVSSTLTTSSDHTALPLVNFPSASFARRG